MTYSIILFWIISIILISYWFTIIFYISFIVICIVVVAVYFVDYMIVFLILFILVDWFTFLGSAIWCWYCWDWCYFIFSIIWPSLCLFICLLFIVITFFISIQYPIYHFSILVSIFLLLDLITMFLRYLYVLTIVCNFMESI